MSYDALGRMTSRTEGEGTTSWTYDTAVKGKGKLHRVAGPGGYVRTHGYDSLGRAQGESETIYGETFRVSGSYDSSGRVATLSYPKAGFGAGRTYTATGYLKSVYKVGTPGTVYWTAGAVNAEGQTTEATLGNGVGTTRSYDAATGLVRSIQSGVGESSAVQDLGYRFDSLGNLTTREDFSQEVYESFAYDRLNRLTGGIVYDAEDDTERESKTYRYDAVGNIVNKSDVGTADYVYGTGNAAGAGDAGPHAVVSAGGNSYAYDDNGNMISGDGRTLTWTSFNKPKTVVSTSTNTRFDYGPERARIRQGKVQGATTTTIKYVGTLFEQVAKTGAATEYVNYVFAGERRVAVYATDNAPTPSEAVQYLHQDHLGSVDTITDESGAVVERLSYDAWGKRRTASGDDAWKDSAIAITAATTPRGFTDHEHLDDFELVHMNGRVYDPVLGRFLSPDPLVQYPESTQAFNRYTYVSNNPLSLVDPTGYEDDEYDNFESVSPPDFDDGHGPDPSTDDYEDGQADCPCHPQNIDPETWYQPYPDINVRTGGRQNQVTSQDNCPCHPGNIDPATWYDYPNTIYEARIPDDHIVSGLKVRQSFTLKNGRLISPKNEAFDTVVFKQKFPPRTDELSVNLERTAHPNVLVVRLTGSVGTGAAAFLPNIDHNVAFVHQNGILVAVVGAHDGYPGVQIFHKGERIHNHEPGIISIYLLAGELDIEVDKDLTADRRNVPQND